jgi:radical SAM protein with 4Fe4S-binding SPASM domain
MCDHWQRNGSSDELSTGEVIDSLDGLKALGTPVLSLSGEGEITLRADAPAIMRACAERGFLFSLNSNLLHLPAPFAQAVAQSAPYQLTVGMDTADAVRYGAIRGIEDGFERVQRSIDALHSHGYENIVVGTVIMDSNLDDLMGLVEFVRARGLKGIRFTAFQPSGFGKRWEPQELERYRSSEYLDHLHTTIEAIIAAKKGGTPILNSVPYLRMVSEHYAQPGFFPIPCHIPWRRLHIHPDGRVSLCVVMEEGGVIGSLRQNSLEQLWHGAKAEALRAQVRAKGCGGCWLSCYSETNIRLSARYALGGLANAAQRFLSLGQK